MVNHWDPPGVLVREAISNACRMKGRTLEKNSTWVLRAQPQKLGITLKEHVVIMVHDVFVYIFQITLDIQVILSVEHADLF